jgi:hypothetical protein
MRETKCLAYAAVTGLYKQAQAQNLKGIFFKLQLPDLHRSTSREAEQNIDEQKTSGRTYLQIVSSQHASSCRHAVGCHTSDRDGFLN